MCQALNYAPEIHKVNKANEISTLMKLIYFRINMQQTNTQEYFRWSENCNSKSIAEQFWGEGTSDHWFLFQFAETFLIQFILKTVILHSVTNSLQWNIKILQIVPRLLFQGFSN